MRAGIRGPYWSRVLVRDAREPLTPSAVGRLSEGSVHRHWTRSRDKRRLSLKRHQERIPLDRSYERDSQVTWGSILVQTTSHKRNQGTLRMLVIGTGNRGCWRIDCFFSQAG